MHFNFTPDSHAISDEDLAQVSIDLIRELAACTQPVPPILLLISKLIMRIVEMRADHAATANLKTPRELVTALMVMGYTPYRIAQVTGVHQPTIDRIFTGETEDPKSSLLISLHRFYHSPHPVPGKKRGSMRERKGDE